MAAITPSTTIIPMHTQTNDILFFVYCLQFTAYSLQLIALTDQMGLPGYHL